MGEIVHYCNQCGKKMERVARCEFYCKDCDNTMFDWGLDYKDKEYEYEVDETNWREVEDGDIDWESIKRKKKRW